MGDDAEAWLTSLKLCISETVAMRHPHPMEHIARMLVDPSFQESLGLPTAEYVQRHDLEQRITNALGVAGFKAGDAVPSDMSSRLSAQLLADALRDVRAHALAVDKQADLGLADAWEGKKSVGGVRGRRAEAAVGRGTMTIC